MAKKKLNAKSAKKSKKIMPETNGKKASKRTPPKNKQDKKPISIKKVIDLLIEGKSYRTIAELLKIPLSTLHYFTSMPEHSARVREALEYSASTFADKAEQVLTSLVFNSSPISFQRARELAHHYRWKASKRNPKKYGDRIDVTSKDEKVNALPAIITLSNGTNISID